MVIIEFLPAGTVVYPKIPAKLLEIMGSKSRRNPSNEKEGTIKTIVRRRTAMKRDWHNHVHSDNACTVSGSSSTEPPVKGPPPPTETMAQGNSLPQEPVQVVVLAPIDDSAGVRPSSPAGAYTLKATSGLPSGCAEFDGFNAERVGDSFRVEVTNLMPRLSLIVGCTSIYGDNESEISLGSGLIVGETYTVTINEASRSCLRPKTTSCWPWSRKSRPSKMPKWPRPTADICLRWHRGSP